MKLMFPRSSPNRCRPVWLAGLAALASLGLAYAQPADAAKPPFWAEKGVFVYRVFTPDSPDTLTYLEEGLVITGNLIDGVRQIPIMNGLIGHDHPGAWNWDGLWPYWNRVTFRSGNSWDQLSKFMLRARDEANALPTFHVNLTDVNIGLRDYPESRAFFQKLVETKSIYRRDYNRVTDKREGEPYVPVELDPYIAKRDESGAPDPVPIFALVNYQRFWESGLAKQMIDEFYSHLPYPPPLLYLDVLTLSGGNFSTGFPDGALGGSKETQMAGVVAIVDYLRSKGTDLATEGKRAFLGKNADGSYRAGYEWYHGAGFSNDDYSVISGGRKVGLASHHVMGNPGAYAVSPIASTPGGIAAVKAHYAALLDGKPSGKVVAGLDTYRLARRSGESKVDEFDIPGANGDRFRGDWADLVNHFYLTVIQELYHLGNRSVRQRDDPTGRIHLGKLSVTSPSGAGQEWVVSDFTATKGRPFVMLEEPVTLILQADADGPHAVKLSYKVPGRAAPRLNVYVNGERVQTLEKMERPTANGETTIELSALPLKLGNNEVTFDPGPIRATWSDGTLAEWTTPSLRKGFRVTNGDVVFAEDYDRMWPDTWSGQKKIYFFSWDGTNRAWKLPEGWRDLKQVTLYPLTPTGRGKGVRLSVNEGCVSPPLRPQVPFVLVPESA